MRLIRVVPTLLLKGAGLVKGRRFRRHRYVGDPINAVRIFNEKEVDELVLVDIAATPERRTIPLATVADIASECFMPLTVGGGVTTLRQAGELLACGVEKVLINTAAVETPDLIGQLADRFGSQSVVVAIDHASSLFRRQRVMTHAGTRSTRSTPEAWAREVADRGAGEILLTSIDREGSMSGYDIETLRRVTAAVQIPVVAGGGAGSVDHLAAAVHGGGAAAVAAGSMFVFHGRHHAVLINVPDRAGLESAFKAS